jgi:hypothetical protein
VANYNEKQARAEYEKLDKDDLYELCKARDLRGLSKATKPELIEALVADDKAEVKAAKETEESDTAADPSKEPPKDGAIQAPHPDENKVSPNEVKTNPKNDKPDEPEGERTAPTPQVPPIAPPLQQPPLRHPGQGPDQNPDEDPDDPDGTARKEAEHNAMLADQIRRIRAAQTEKLEMVLNEPFLPEHLRSTIEDELQQRQARAAEAAAVSRLKTQIARYRVTKGGRYCITGYVGELPTGSLITDKTHNLREVRRQGIEFEPASHVELSTDQLGRQISRVV